MIDPRMSDFHINIRVLDCVQFPKCLATGTVDVLGTLLHGICSDKEKCIGYTTIVQILNIY